MTGLFLDRSRSLVVVLGCYLLLVARVPNFVVFCHGLFQVVSVSTRIAFFFNVVQVVTSCFGILQVVSIVYDVEE